MNHFHLTISFGRCNLFPFPQVRKSCARHMAEVAPFNIGVTIVEPGSARTNFRYQSSTLAPKIDAYEVSPAIHARRIIEEAKAPSLGDPAKMAAAMINSVDLNPAPKRIVLGSDAYSTIHKALTERLAELEQQKDLAFSTDFN